MLGWQSVYPQMLSHTVLVERRRLAMLYLHALSDPLVALEEVDLQDTLAECKITSVQISLAQQPCL